MRTAKKSMIHQKIIIINQKQFGYHSDTYYYCKHLRNDYIIKYICWDYGEKKLYLKNIKVKYISRKGNIVLRNARFIFKVVSELKKNEYDLHLIKYFRGCSLLKIYFPQKKFLLDIRSGSIKKNFFNRFLYNSFLKFEALFYPDISVISKNLARKLGLFRKAFILPLGADILSLKEKKFNSINLLYVGTLFNRNIDQTIKGFSKFYRQYKHKLKISYTIIGSGYSTEVENLKSLVISEELETSIKITGKIPHNKLGHFFDVHNIGVSFIPKTTYFNFQPPTKTFEYLLAGMPVIATGTLENKAIINSTNGVLVEDTCKDFYKGLCNLYINLNTFNSNEIRLNAMKYTWHEIIAHLKLKINLLIDM